MLLSFTLQTSCSTLVGGGGGGGIEGEGGGGIEGEGELPTYSYYSHQVKGVRKASRYFEVGVCSLPSVCHEGSESVTHVIGESRLLSEWLTVIIDY